MPTIDVPPVSDRPFISVVTVSLNAASTIRDTIASVALQRAPFLVEHVCVDGGSTDGTRQIIDQWANRSSQLVRLYEPDSGIFDAMNKGLCIAGGEYVLFLNADDFLIAPDVLARAMEGLSPGSRDNPDLVAGGVAMGDPGGWGVWRRRRVPRLLGRLRGWGLYPLHQGQFTRRQLLLDIGGFDSRLRFSADVVQYYDLERRSSFAVRILSGDVAFMRDGGAANAGWKARYRATCEFYRHLSSTYGPVRGGIMVVIKTLQSLLELRCGRCPHKRWFAAVLQ